MMQNLYLKRFFLLSFLILNIIINLDIQAGDVSLAPLHNLPPGGLSNYVRNVRDSYNNLRTYQNDILNNGLQANNTNLREYLELINDLKASFYQTRTAFQHPTEPDSIRLLSTLQSSLNNINQFINQYNHDAVLKNSTKILFENVLLRLKDRYRLANVERQIRNNNGWMGNLPNNVAPLNIAIFRNTIEKLTGRIFVIDPDNNNPKIISTSSGMIIPRQHNAGQVYDQIITCGHSMKSGNTSPELEFYFVRTESLDLQSGLPDSINISDVIHGGGVHNQQHADININTQNFIQYLRTESNNIHSNSVRRITSFQAFAHPALRQISQLDDHSPRYLAHQDNGYGNLNNNGFVFPHGQFAIVNILQALPVNPGGYDYYAIGYPGFSYFNTANQRLLLRERRFSPFTMVKSNSLQQTGGHLTLTIGANQKLRHGASTMKGMSGGPILKFDQLNNTIEILGVVQSGYLDTNHGTKFW